MKLFFFSLLAFFCACRAEESAGVKAVREELAAWEAKHPDIHVIVQVSRKPTAWCVGPTDTKVYRILMHDEGAVKNRKKIRHELKHVEQMERGEDPNTPDNEWEAHQAEHG